jgi:hypothetical protein
MSDPIKVSVTLEWRGNRLMAGPYQLGEVMKPMPMPQSSARALGIDNRNQEKWIGLRGDIATGYHATEAEARAAVEAAVIAAMGGERHE